MPVHIRTHRLSGSHKDIQQGHGWATLDDHKAFLTALEGNDGDVLLRLAEVLVDSFLLLPDDACHNIGVPLGSNYAQGIRVLFPDGF